MADNLLLVPAAADHKSRGSSHRQSKSSDKKHDKKDDKKSRDKKHSPAPSPKVSPNPSKTPVTPPSLTPRTGEDSDPKRARSLSAGTLKTSPSDGVKVRADLARRPSTTDDIGLALRKVTKEELRIPIKIVTSSGESSGGSDKKPIGDGPKTPKQEALEPKDDKAKKEKPSTATPTQKKFSDLPPKLRDHCLHECKFSTDYCEANARMLYRIGYWLHPDFFPKQETKPTPKDATEQNPSEKATAVEEGTKAICSADRIAKARALISRTPDTPLKKKYEKQNTAGSGAFGAVIMAKEKLAVPILDKKKKKTNKRLVAIKMVPHNTVKHHQANLVEIGFLSTLSHPNIVTFYDAWVVKDTKKKKSLEEDIWIVTEYLDGGTFENAAGKMSEASIAFLAHEINQALLYLHSNNLVHRDLKSPNVMITIEAEVKLIDFGLCREVDPKIKRIEMCGSPCFVPPEMILSNPHGCPADIWSFGVCLLEVTSGHPPFFKTPMKCMALAATEGLVSSVSQNVSANMKDFLSKCLVVDPEKRSTAAQLKDHPWINALDLEKSKKEMIPVLMRMFMTELNL